MKTIRLFILGHSYVHNLQNTGVKTLNLGEFCLVIGFFPVSGARFSSFINREDWKQELLDFCPDFILVILGGNDIGKDLTNSNIQEQYKRLCYILHQLPRKLIILFAEIEKRKLPEPSHSHLNRFTIPLKDWVKRRRALNNYYNNSPLCH